MEPEKLSDCVVKCFARLGEAPLHPGGFIRPMTFWELLRMTRTRYLVNGELEQWMTGCTDVLCVMNPALHAVCNSSSVT